MNTRDTHSASSSDDLQRQARVWLRLLDSGDVTEVDAQAFRRWLDTSADHKAAFNTVKHRWATLRTASGMYADRHPNAIPAPAPARPARRQPSAGRRAFIGGAVTVGAAAAVAGFYPDVFRRTLPDPWGGDERTAVGEQRTLTLAAQTVVTLNTQTRVRQSVHNGKTVSMTLLSGEAAVDLGGVAEPFTMSAGVGSARAHDGRFEVRYLDGKACVTCIDGSVQVSHPAGKRALQARQQVAYNDHVLSDVGNVNAQAVSAWRRGELVFDQIRLVDVVAEINRYRAGRVVLVSEAARNQRVTGRFRIASLDAALSQLESTFDLNARSLPGGLLILS
ncbi:MULTISPECIES: FecR domain-containing protein [Pandoraea]|uniref:FecR family protein n=1 Tax=Pandoraea TaxID=93217 RepID=UPI000330EBE2|nr:MULTISPECIES: FecR domain-containing protein [Pandoraea]EON14838.1 Fe2+-dicitrate sensor, membrane protein [Pandoraea sp. SD6-2]MDM8359670.1 FecR domain-containing protein [Pandoraea communis]